MVLVEGNFEVDGRLPLRSVVMAVLVRATVDLWLYDLVADSLVQMCEIVLLFHETRCERMEELVDVRCAVYLIGMIIPIARPGVFGMLPSFFDKRESFLVERAEGIRGPADNEPLNCKRACADLPPPPDPVLLIVSPPPVSGVLLGTGDGAKEPFDTVTFLICARTCESCRS